MFRISQKTEYALRAMIDLTLRRDEGLVSARSIAESQHIPLRFLEQQLGALHKAGLVESFRGAGGGCRLARDASEIRVADVADVIEGPLYPMFCLDPETGEDEGCFQTSHCGLQELWVDLGEAVRGVFERTTIADLAERHRHASRRQQVVWMPAELTRPAN